MVYAFIAQFLIYFAVVYAFMIAYHDRSTKI